MTNTYPPRPTWNHPDTKVIAAQEIVDAVHAWTVEVGLDIPNDRELRAVITLAMQESPDAYMAGRYLDSFLGWPVDAELVRVFDSAYRRLKFLKTPLVHAWVMEHRVRFPAKKGQAVVARIGDIEVKVKIEDILKREAAAYGEVVGRPGKRIRVHAEEVMKVINLGSSKGPGDFPTGGTPVAAAMKAEKKVA